MGILFGCVKCVDLSGKDKLAPCSNIRPPDNTGMLYDLAHLGYIFCSIDGCNYLSNADRKCANYKPSLG